MNVGHIVPSTPKLILGHNIIPIKITLLETQLLTAVGGVTIVDGGGDRDCPDLPHHR